MENTAGDLHQTLSHIYTSIAEVREENKKLRQEVERLKRVSGVFPSVAVGEFSKAKYLELHPDVDKANIDAWIHFQNYGFKEVRKIGVKTYNGDIVTGIWCDFGYKLLYADVDNSGESSGWKHYKEVGNKEGRQICIRLTQ